MTRTADKCFTANQLYSVYKNARLKSLLIFIQPHLKAVQRVNKMFQGSSSTDMSKLFNELCFLIEETALVITVKRPDFDPLTSMLEDYLIPNPNLGYNFERHISENVKNGNLSRDEVDNIRKQCIKFIASLVYSLRRRLPENIKILRHINNISADRALRVTKPSLVPILEELKIGPAVISNIEAQWKNLTLVQWSEKSVTESFWYEVKSFKDAGGNNPFCDLVTLVYRLLALPFSNAEVERTFSQLNFVKNKVRNRMDCNMVNAIIMIRSSLKNAGKCCHDFDISSEMIKGIGTTSIYNNQSSIENHHDSELDLIDEHLFN